MLLCKPDILQSCSPPRFSSVTAAAKPSIDLTALGLEQELVCGLKSLLLGQRTFISSTPFFLLSPRLRT